LCGRDLYPLRQQITVHGWVRFPGRLPT